MQANSPRTGRGRHRARLVAIVAFVALVAVLVAVRLSDDGDRSPWARSTAPGADEAPASWPTTSLARPDELGGIGFTDIAAEVGLTGEQSNEPRTGDASQSAGAAVADLTGTGASDVFLTRVGLPNQLYRRGPDGRYRDVAAEVGLAGADPATGSGPAAFGDFDADGCEDLFVAGGRGGTSAMYRNDCAGHFVDVTAGSGLDDVVSVAQNRMLGGVTVADPDRDGDLDLLVLEWDTNSAPFVEVLPESTCDSSRDPETMVAPDRATNLSRLYANDGTGQFEDVTDAAGLDLWAIVAFTGQWVDVTGDGWDDLLITGDACTSRLYRNDGGTSYTDITAEAGVGTDENGMGSVVRDLNGDGLADWLISSIAYPPDVGECPRVGALTGCSGNRYYESDGYGRFVDRTDALGIRDGGWGWGAAIEDFGDDGRLSIVMANGFRTGSSSDKAVFRRFFDHFGDDAMRLWIPVDGVYRSAADVAGIADAGLTTAVVPFDEDGDGDLDLLVTGNSEVPRLYRNDRPAGRHWLTVRLDDPARPGNRSGVGARVVVSADGANDVTGWIQTGGSYQAQKPAELHVGFGGEVPQRVRVSVWWPGAGAAQVVEVPAVDRVLTIARG